MPILLPMHIIAGLIAIAAGAIALYATKGSPQHRRSGMVFVVAMLTMTSVAALMAAFLRPNIGNVIAALLTFYLVSTGVLTVRRPTGHARAASIGLALLAFCVGTMALTIGATGTRDSHGMIDGLPVAPIFVFGTVGVAGALLDLRLLLAGTIQGAHRLARHLWRMGLAMFIATASFFLGQPKVFPEPLRHAFGLRAIPVLLVVATLLYWLVRVCFKRQPLAPMRAPDESLSPTFE